MLFTAETRRERGRVNKLKSTPNWDDWKLGDRRDVTPF
jgi:hypothetical protein